MQLREIVLTRSGGDTCATISNFALKSPRFLIFPTKTPESPKTLPHRLLFIRRRMATLCHPSTGQRDADAANEATAPTPAIIRVPTPEISHLEASDHRMI